MRGITGLTEAPGEANNPKILEMARKIVDVFGDMESYCDQYIADSTAWCGLACAYAMAMAGIRPPFGETDTEKFLWALAWSGDDQYQPIDDPVPGCVVVMTRSGGGHVTLYERTEGSNYICLGGNQSDMVNESSYPINGVVGLYWPKDGGEMPRRELAEGDEGADVMEVQSILGLNDDGDFGPVTKAGVQGYQTAVGLNADGVVGQSTWAALDRLDARVKAGTDGLQTKTKDKIIAIAERSTIARYYWSGRGVAPIGYITGMALTFGLAVSLLKISDLAALEMSKAATGKNSSNDALDWYADIFSDMDMDNSIAGLDTLRHLFCLLLGLGMRESAGNHWCGRDQSASNTDAMTCEAGLFQTSWNINSCNDNIPELFEVYWGDPNGFLYEFNDGSADPLISADLKNYGHGAGARYQWLAKYSPAFAALMTAIGLRNLRQHWGPINRHEAAVTEEADIMFRQVQQVIMAGTIDPTPPMPPDLPHLPVVGVALTISEGVNVSISINGENVIIDES
jgi:uncharacterized protein (TIGR02594 family)